MRPFEGCRQRIERAKAHSKTLAERWRLFTEREPYSVSIKMEDNGTGRILIWLSEPFPDDFALELGEMLYQFRAALDGCIYDAAILETGKDPPPNQRQLAFPLCGSVADFQQAARNIAPLPEKLRLIVDSVQPYRTPKLTPYVRALSINRALGILNDWARKDRHRQLHVMASWAANFRPKLRLPDGVEVARMTLAEPGFLKGEYEVAHFGLTGYRPGMNIQANPDAFIDIAVDEIPPPSADNDTLGHRVIAITVAVETVVTVFEQFFSEKSEIK